MSYAPPPYPPPARDKTGNFDLPVPVAPEAQLIPGALGRLNTVSKAVYTGEDYDLVLPRIIKTLNRIQNPDLWNERSKLGRKQSVRKLFGLKNKYTPEDHRNVELRFVVLKKYTPFYTLEEQILTLLRQQHELTRLDTVRQVLGFPAGSLEELAQLVAFDVVLYIDNSGLMTLLRRQLEFRQMMQYIRYLPEIGAASFSIRFMNNHDRIALTIRRELNILLDNMTSLEDVERIFQSDKVVYSGQTPLATELRKHVLEDFVFKKVRTRSFKHPLFVLILTDGVPYGELPEFQLNGVYKLVKQTQNELIRAGYSPTLVVYQFAQVGDDKDAAAYLDDLDDNKEVGDVIDVTNVYSKENVQLNSDTRTAVGYFKKLLLGAVDELMDQADEKK